MILHFITASKVESFVCVYHLCVYVHSTVMYTQLQFCKLANCTICSGLVIMIPFDQLLLPGLAG